MPNNVKAFERMTPQQQAEHLVYVHGRDAAYYSTQKHGSDRAVVKAWMVETPAADEDESYAWPSSRLGVHDNDHEDEVMSHTHDDTLSVAVKDAVWIVLACLVTLLLTVSALVGVAKLLTRSQALPAPYCTLEYHLAEDGSWDGHGVTVDGLRIADHWRVADYHLEDTITADQSGQVGLNVVWTPGYKGTPCELVRTFTDS